MRFTGSISTVRDFPPQRLMPAARRSPRALPVPPRMAATLHTMQAQPTVKRAIQVTPPVPALSPPKNTLSGHQKKWVQAVVDTVPDYARAPLQGQASRFARVNADAARVWEGSLDPRGASYFAQAQTTRPKAVVLLFHGFGAGPFEFYDWTPGLTENGVAVYAVRAPGHGERARGKANPDALPLAHQTHLYTEHVKACAAEAEAYAQEHGIPLYIGGFSLGGAMALDAATSTDRKVPVDRLFVVAPLVRPGHKLTQALFEVMRQHHDNPWVQQFMNRVPAVGGQISNFGGPGYAPFPLHRSFAAVDYANGVQERTRALKAEDLPPVHLIGSKIDVTTDWQAPLELLESIGVTPASVLLFEREEKVAHSMVGAYENRDAKSLKKINDRALQVLQPD